MLLLTAHVKERETVGANTHQKDLTENLWEEDSYPMIMSA